MAVCLIAMAGCGKVKLAPVPPDWNECVPSEPDYVDMAYETRDRPPPLKPGTTPEQAHKEALDRLEALGHELTIGRPPGYESATDPDQNFCGTTLPGHVYVSQECYDAKGDDHLSWARFLRHEETHARQQVRMGLYFFSVYAYGEGRLLAIETPAFDEEYETHEFFMVDRPELELQMPTEEQMRARALGIYDRYSGAHIPKECFAEIAVKVWKNEQ
jgi:hypothetical protein